MGEADKHGVEAGQDRGVESDGNALVSHLRDEVAYLRDENRRKDQIIMQQAITLRHLATEPQKPSENAEKVEEVEEGPDTAPGGPHPVTGGSPEGAQQRNGPPAPAEELAVWKYASGAAVLFVVNFCVPYLASALALNEGSVSAAPLSVEFLLTVTILGLVWLAPGFFGLWAGFRRRATAGRHGGWPRAVFAGLAIGIVGMLGLWEGTLQQGELTLSDPGATLIPWIFLPTTILYISGELIGNAWRRRSAGNDQGEVLALSASGSAWSPRSQAMLGFAGTIIAALISLVGTVISVAWGS